MFSRFHSFPEKLAIILKCVWAFFALTITAYEAEGFPDSVVVLLCLFVPVLSVEAMRWLFSLKQMPVWTFFLFLPLMSLTFIPLTYELREETIWMLSVAEPVCFYVLRFVNDKIHGHNSLLDDLNLIQGLYKKTPKVIKKSVALALLIIAVLLPFREKINLIRIDMKEQRYGADSLSSEEWLTWRRAQELTTPEQSDTPAVTDSVDEARFDKVFEALDTDTQNETTKSKEDAANYEKCGQIHFKRAFHGNEGLTKEETLILKNEC